LPEDATRNTLEKVSAQFSNEVLTELNEGRTAALQKLDSERRETEEAVTKTLEASARQAEALHRQIIGSAELDSRNIHLRALEESVNQVFQESMSGLAKISGPRREKALGHLILEGTQVIGGEAKVYCSEKDRKAVASILKSMNKDGTKLTLTSKNLDVLGGVILESSEGTIKFDNTFEARLERMRPMLRKAVADILSGGSD
jgi:V/A-type H+-transporting ATPase subunit E